MSTRPKLISGPIDHFIELDAVKAALRLRHVEQDDYIETLISAATGRLDGPEGALGRCIMPQTWSSQESMTFAGSYRLPLVDVRSVAIKYFDTAGVETVLPDTEYQLKEGRGQSVVVFNEDFEMPDTYEDRNEFTFEMTAGLPDASPKIKTVATAAMMMIVQWYRAPDGMTEDRGEIPAGVTHLIRDLKVTRV
ncbi:MAG: hypothetical protein CMM07_25850 [Rhodopirellula sp.]|nr:hypothetical protein [Rhodopirellula sp.]